MSATFSVTGRTSQDENTRTHPLSLHVRKVHAHLPRHALSKPDITRRDFECVLALGSKLHGRRELAELISGTELVRWGGSAGAAAVAWAGGVLAYVHEARDGVPGWEGRHRRLFKFSSSASTLTTAATRFFEVREA